MNDPLSRVLLSWGDSRWYWMPFTRLRPEPQARLALSFVLVHGLAGLLWAGLPFLLLARGWTGHWSPLAFLLPGAAGLLAAVLSSTMLRAAWNRRANQCQARLAAGQPLPQFPPATGLQRFVLGPLLALGIVALGLALVLAEENLRGTLALRSFEAELRAKGAPVALADIIPAPVPADQNLAEAPLLKPMLDFERLPEGDPRRTDSSIRWRDPTGWAHALKRFPTEDPNTSFKAFAGRHGLRDSSPSKRIGAVDTGANQPANRDSWPDGGRINLEAWQAYYRSLTNWPRAAAPQTPARDVLLALSASDADLQQLRAVAAERPLGQFHLRYEDGASMLIPQLAAMKHYAQFLRLRSVALLADGRPDEALADTLLALRFSDLLADEPILVSLLVRRSIDQLSLQSAWEGCLDHRWNDRQLAALQDALGTRDYLPRLRTALDGERLIAGVTYDALARRDGYPSLADSLDPSSDGSLRWIMLLTPRGWVRQSQVAHGRFIQAMVETLARARSHADLGDLDRLLFQYIDLRSPVTTIAAMLAPALGRAGDKVYEAESWRRLALVGLALERSRLAEGRYPQALAELAPRFLREIPADPMTGAPLRYSLGADGDYQLYGVGLDHRDDGGLRSERRARSASDPKRPADLVWR